MAAVWQSPGLATSADKLAKVAAAMHVDVMLGTHFTDGLKKADAMAKASPGAKNPFIIGEASYQAYLKVISECAQAQDIVNRVAAQKTANP